MASEDMKIKEVVFDKKNGHVSFNVDNSGYFTYCLQQSKQQTLHNIPTVSVEFRWQI